MQFWVNWQYKELPKEQSVMKKSYREVCQNRSWLPNFMILSRSDKAFCFQNSAILFSSFI